MVGVLRNSSQAYPSAPTPAGASFQTWTPRGHAEWRPSPVFLASGGGQGEIILGACRGEDGEELFQPYQILPVVVLEGAKGLTHAGDHSPQPEGAGGRGD